MTLVRRRAFALLAIFTASCGSGGSTPDATPDPDGPTPDASPAPPDGPPVDAPPPAIGTACSVPLDLTDATGPMPFDTTFAGNSNGASCSGGAASWGERYFVVDAGATPVDLIVRVAVDENVRRPYDVVLSARTNCMDPDTEVACADSGWGERLEVLAATGEIVLLVDGTDQFMGFGVGPFTIEITRRAIVGDGETCDGELARCADGLACQESTCAPTSPTLACDAAVDLTADLADGEALVDGAVTLTDPDHYTASCAFDATGHDPERIFRFDLAAPATVAASTNFPETTYDTNLTLRPGACDAAELTCSDDVDAAGGEFRTSLGPTSLPAGTYYLLVDMSSAWLYGPAATTPRQFRLQVTQTP